MINLLSTFMCVVMWQLPNPHVAVCRSCVNAWQVIEYFMQEVAQVETANFIKLVSRFIII